MENQVPVFDDTYVSPPSPQDEQAEKSKTKFDTIITQ